MKNIVDIIEKKMPFEARVIFNVLNNKGFDTYIVGGALRDCIFSLESGCDIDVSDWDFATTATVEDIKLCFNKMLKVKNDMGRLVNLRSSTELLIPSLGTTSVKISNKRFEVTPMTCNIESDLAERDFTINSLAYGKEDGLVSKYSVGNREINVLDDIKERKLQFNIKQVEYIKNNPVSIIRAIRFANKFGVSISDEDLNAFREAGKLIRDINKGKLYVNFEKMMLMESFDKSIYIIDSYLLSSVCENWNEEYTEEFVLLLHNSALLEKDIKVRLKYIYENFPKKEMLYSLYESFGVKKDFLMYL